MASMTVYDVCTYGEPPNEAVREFVWQDQVEIIGGIAGRIPCPGCEATGPCPESERDNTDLTCIECKDTGMVWVSV